MLRYLIGPPGSGKSSVLDAWIGRHGLTVDPVSERLQGTLRGHRVGDGWYLGRRRNRFPGTDALSMAVMPDAEAWLAAYAGGDLWGEGTRLGSAKFLRLAGRVCGVTVGLLDGSEDWLEARRSGRGSHQDRAWVKAATSKARNAADAVDGNRGVILVQVRVDGRSLDRIVDSLEGV